MKKITKIFLTGIMVFTLTGCSGNNQNTENTPNPTNTPTPPGETEGTTNNEEWGVLESFMTTKNQKNTIAYINFPHYTGILEATGLVSHGKDETRVVLDAYISGISPEVNSVSEVFPAYSDQTIKIFEVNFGSRYSNGKLVLDNKETVTINGYEMCKYIGTHTFKYKKEERSYKFVAYATKLKTNGAYIYWLVQDESDNQSQFSKIEDYAYKMATTLWEE